VTITAMFVVKIRNVLHTDKMPNSTFGKMCMPPRQTITIN